MKLIWMSVWALLCVGQVCAAPESNATPNLPAVPWTLAAVLQRAGQASREVLGAQRALDGAQADQLTATATPPPQLSVNSQSIDPRHLGSGSLWHRPVDTIVRIDQTLERAGKAAWRERAAQAGVAAARNDLIETIRLQRIAAAQAYWDLKLAQEQLDISQRNGRLAQSSSQAAQLRLAQGDLSRLEATRLAVEAERAANEQAVAGQQLTQARWALSQILALDDRQMATAILATDPWPDADARVPAEQIRPQSDADWLTQRPDVLAAGQRVNQAQHALDLAQAQRKADVTVGVQFEHDPPNGNHLWGVGVSVPLGMEGRQDGPVARALAALADAQAQLDKIRADAVAERARQMAGLEASRERLHRLQEKILPQAHEAVKAAEYARQQGALALQDVLDARRTLHAAELELAAAHDDHAKALAALGIAADFSMVNP